MKQPTVREQVKAFRAAQMQRSRETAKGRKPVCPAARPVHAGMSVKRARELAEGLDKGRIATVEQAMRNIMRYGDPVLREALERGGLK